MYVNEALELGILARSGDIVMEQNARQYRTIVLAALFHDSGRFLQSDSFRKRSRFENTSSSESML